MNDEISVPSDNEEEIFSKKKSVFSTFKLDTKAALSKSFENDFNLTKINKLFKDKDELAKVKKLLCSLYPRLMKIFLAEACDSTYPNIGYNDFIIWCKECKFFANDHK